MFYHESPENLICPPTPEWKRSPDLDLNGEAVPDEDDDGNTDALLHVCFAKKVLLFLSQSAYLSIVASALIHLFQRVPVLVLLVYVMLGGHSFLVSWPLCFVSFFFVAFALPLMRLFELHLWFILFASQMII